MYPPPPHQQKKPIFIIYAVILNLIYNADSHGFRKAEGITMAKKLAMHGLGNNKTHSFNSTRIYCSLQRRIIDTSL